jgi:hypothetical protein
MQELSIIRQATVPFIVHFGSNKCKIKNMKTIDGSNYNTESFKILENIYKQEVIPESLYRFNESIASYDDFELADNYHDILKKYENYNEQDKIQKQLYYEAYIEPVLNKLESYITRKYGADKNLRQILNEIKLEFTTDSDYLLQYYTYKDFIRKENESKKEENFASESRHKAKIIINTPNNTETAELELNIQRDVIVMVYIDTQSGQDSVALLTALANLVNSGKLEQLINSNYNVKIVRIYIQKETEVTYALYADDSLLLEKNTVRVVSLLHALLAAIKSILTRRMRQIVNTNKILYGGLLFIVTIYGSLSSDFARKLVVNLASEFIRLNKTLKNYNELILAQVKQSILDDRKEQIKNPLSEKLKKGEITRDEFNTKLDEEYSQLTDTPDKGSIVAVYTLFALAVSLVIFQMLGMPLIVQFIMAFTVTTFTAFIEKDDFKNTLIYIAVNFEETFKYFITSTDEVALAAKGLIAGWFVIAVLILVKRIRTQKEPSSSFPGPDRILTEIRNRFK